MDEKQKRALAARLFQRLGTAVKVRQVGDKIEGWKPEPGRCHENVAAWLERNPHHRPVRGWLYAQYLAPPCTAPFLSHSVIETDRGELIDVSLPSTEWTHPFLRHESSEEEFLALVRNNGCPRLDHIIGGDS